MVQIMITHKDDTEEFIRTSKPVVLTGTCVGYKPDNQKQTVYLFTDSVKSIVISEIK